MTTTHDLLSRGYFPKELPPTFCSDDFANKVVAPLGGMPQTFQEHSRTARLCEHNLARAGTLRRKLGLPNPVLQYNLCRLIEKNWRQIRTASCASVLSQSYPVESTRRALTPASVDLTRMRAKVRATSTYLLATDISLFYHSVYTHSIPWAIHGKARAKRDRRNERLVGNQLDKLIRNAQDQQTMGIPIGPDTSLIVAEILLSAVDKKVLARIPKLRGFRFMDDYELHFSTRANADQALARLQEAMGEFELSLNATKTRIDELPLELVQPWMTQVRSFNFRESGSGQAADLVRYFDQAYAISRQNPNKHVLGYGIGRLRGIDIRSSNWPLFQDLMFQAILAEPGTTALVLEQVSKYLEAGESLDRTALTNVVNIQIVNHAPIGHSSEVAWALWTALAFDLKIYPRAAKVISRIKDSVVALLALHARDEGLIGGTLGTGEWSKLMTTEEHYGGQWLLSYEASIKGWLPSFARRDHIANDDNFSWLRSMGVEFYDVDRASRSVIDFTPVRSSPADDFVDFDRLDWDGGDYSEGRRARAENVDSEEPAF